MHALSIKERVSALQLALFIIFVCYCDRVCRVLVGLHPLIFGCYCDRVCRVLVGFCSQRTVY